MQTREDYQSPDAVKQAGGDGAVLPEIVSGSLRRQEPFLWINSRCDLNISAVGTLPVTLKDLQDAREHLARFAPLLERLFPELTATSGRIESPIVCGAKLKALLEKTDATPGRWFIKCDHALPIAGSIKARGGFFEVLTHAEKIAAEAGLIGRDSGREILSSQAARDLFSTKTVTVGSTGNLGLSIGILASALGFRTVVHMSADAKQWKKDRLRASMVQVVEHEGDFGSAVSAGRSAAASMRDNYFVDDEQSSALLLGYSTAVWNLATQFAEQEVTVDADHPLFVYLPCGVGGAAAGIAFGLKSIFGRHVHCFIAEPTASPALIVRLANIGGASLSVYDVGLDNRTEADGLAVAKASELAATVLGKCVSGGFTVADETLFADLFSVERSLGLRIEPSAAAGFRGPCWIWRSAAGRRYLEQNQMSHTIERSTHLLWTTGGSLLPDSEYRIFHARGRVASASETEDSCSAGRNHSKA